MRLRGRSRWQEVVLCASSSFLLSVPFVASASQSSVSEALALTFLGLAAVNPILRRSRLIALSNVIVIACSVCFVAATLIYWLPRGHVDTMTFFLTVFAMPGLLATASLKVQFRASLASEHRG